MHNMHTRIGFDKLEEYIQCVWTAFKAGNHFSQCKNDKDLEGIHTNKSITKGFPIYGNT